MKKILFIFCILLIFIFAGFAFGQTGVKKKRALPHEYGNVIINNYSEKAGLAPVEFNHWAASGDLYLQALPCRYRFRHEGRLHDIRASDNKKGFYCGTRHSGKMVYIERCDKLKPRIEKLDESAAKVYLRRLRMRRDLYAYVLESGPR